MFAFPFAHLTIVLGFYGAQQINTRWKKRCFMLNGQKNYVTTRHWTSLILSFLTLACAVFYSLSQAQQAQLDSRLIHAFFFFCNFTLHHQFLWRREFSGVLCNSFYFLMFCPVYFDVNYNVKNNICNVQQCHSIDFGLKLHSSTSRFSVTSFLVTVHPNEFKI